MINTLKIPEAIITRPRVILFAFAVFGIDTISGKFRGLSNHLEIKGKLHDLRHKFPSHLDIKLLNEAGKKLFLRHYLVTGNPNPVTY